MTESEWLLSSDPEMMLRIMNPHNAKECHKDSPWWTFTLSTRKLRLFACSCCRQPDVWARLTDGASRKAILIAERFADGLATVEELDAASESAANVYENHEGSSEPEGCAYVCCDTNVNQTAYWLVRSPSVTPLATQAALLREIFGNPFRPVTIPQLETRIPSGPWLTNTVVGIARRIYDERRFEDMPILADALEDNGCTDEAMLQHCRSGEPHSECLGEGCRRCDNGFVPLRGPHVRGCWVIDLILGKE